MALGLVSEGLLVDPPESFPFLLHGLLWHFPNKQATQGRGFLISMRFLGIAPLLDSLRRYLKEQWFSLWFQTRRSLSSRPKGSLVSHVLTMSSLVRLSPTTYLPTSSNLVGIWDGISVGVRRCSPDSGISPWPKIWIFQVSPQVSSLVRFSRVENLGGSDPLWYITMYLGDK